MNNSPILNGWKEIAKFLNVHEETARKMEEDGMPVAKIGGKIMASANALEKWIISNSIKEKE